MGRGALVRMLLPAHHEEAPDLRDLYDTPGPSLRAGMLQSLDGAVQRDGRSAPLQRPGDGEVFRALRAVADVVLVGAGTARAEEYGPVLLSDADRAWRAARGRAPSVPLAVVSRSLQLPDGAAWLDGTALLVTSRASVAQAAERAAALAGRARLVVAGDDEVDLADAVRQLARLGLARVLCEGGPRLLGDLARADLLDEVCLTVSPVLVGGGSGSLAGPLPDLADVRLVHLLQERDTLLGRWEVLR